MDLKSTLGEVETRRWVPSLFQKKTQNMNSKDSKGDFFLSVGEPEKSSIYPHRPKKLSRTVTPFCYAVPARMALVRGC